MAIPKFLQDLSIISKLGDNPGTDNGLSSAGLRAKFDEAGIAIQNYINNTLIPSISGLFNPEEGLNMKNNISMGGHLVTGLGEPQDDGDAVSLGFANRNYGSAIKQNKDDIEKLNTDKLDKNKLPEAVNNALAQAKDSGEFDGKDGEDGLGMFCSNRDRLELDDYLALTDIVVPSGYMLKIGDLILMPNGDVERVTELVNQLDGATEVRTKSTGINLKGEDGEDGEDGGGDVMIVTVNGNTASHSASQISSHVKSGGTAIFKYGDAIYSYAGSDDVAGLSMFLAINGDAPELGVCVIGGNYVTYHTYEFANDYAKTLVVTVTGNVSSKSSQEIAAHVKAGGTVVLQRGENLYNFVNYSEDTRGACFMMVDPMDGEYLETATVSGTRVTFYTLPFATEAELDQKVSNPNFANVGQTIAVKSVDEDGKPTEWEAVDMPSGGGGSSTMIVTVDGNVNGSKASHTSLQIANHIKAGGMAVLELPGSSEICNFVNYNENDGYAVFIGADHMEESEYFEYLICGSSFFRNRLKSVDDILDEGRTIFPVTYFEGTGEEFSTGEGWEWDCGEGLFFNIEEPLVEGKTYSVIVDGVRYTAVAKKHEVFVPSLALEVSGMFRMYYYLVGMPGFETFNTSIYPYFWTEEGDTGLLMQSVSIGIEASATIKNEYLDMDAIVAAVVDALPSAEGGSY